MKKSADYPDDLQWAQADLWWEGGRFGDANTEEKQQQTWRRKEREARCSTHTHKRRILGD